MIGIIRFAVVIRVGGVMLIWGWFIFVVVVSRVMLSRWVSVLVVGMCYVWF